MSDDPLEMSLSKKGGCNEQHEKNIPDPEFVVARHGAWQQCFIGANQTRCEYLSYDGKDFVRTETTLMNDGQSAVGTKLEP